MEINEHNLKDIIALVYKAEENKIDAILIKINKQIKDEMKKINIEDARNTKEIEALVKQIEDNYNIRISKYNEEMYKIGFKDGINLMLNCLQK